MNRSLGQILVNQNLITDEQVNEALDYKENNRTRFGEACVKLGFIDKNQLINVLSVQLYIPQVDLNHFEIDGEMIDLLDKDTANDYNVLPLYAIDNELMLAIADPLNVSTIDTISRMTGMKIQLAIATTTSIRQSIQDYYSIYSEPSEEEIAPEKEETVEITEETSEKVIMVADRILKEAVETGASDIHIEHSEKNIRVRIRVDGMLQKYRTLPKSHAAPLVSRYKVMAGIDIAESRKPQDGRFKFQASKSKSVDLRVSTYPSAYGEKVVMRILDQSKGNIPLKKLGFSADILELWEKACSNPNGIVLVTGPTGSGKSTTLYATLNIVNSIQKNIVTIEDPIEYKLDGIVQAQVNERAGMTFPAALRAMLRQDPDIIMVGEMRDRETIGLAIRAALTGHLVFSTLHTNNASSSYTRLVDMGTDSFLLSSSIRAILAQRLVRVLCPKCKVEYEPSKKEMASVGLNSIDSPIYKVHKKPCKNCRGTGYRGRAGLYELLIPSNEINALVTNGATDLEIQKVATSQNMKQLKDEGCNFVMKGITSIEEIIRVL